MSQGVTVEYKVEISGVGRRRVLRHGSAPAAHPPGVLAGRIPRVSRLLALAIRVEGLIQRGEVADYAEAARLGHITRARMSQIMDLLNLAPDIQERILHFPCVAGGRDLIAERSIREIGSLLAWSDQRRRWSAICARHA